MRGGSVALIRLEYASPPTPKRNKNLWTVFRFGFGVAGFLLIGQGISIISGANWDPLLVIAVLILAFICNAIFWLGLWNLSRLSAGKVRERHRMLTVVCGAATIAFAALADELFSKFVAKMPDSGIIAWPIVVGWPLVSAWVALRRDNS